VSTSRGASELNYSSSSSSYGYDSSARQTSFSRRRAISPPKAQSFIERWSAEPFYGSGFVSRPSLVRDERGLSQYRSASQARGESQYRSTRAESQEREASLYRSTRAESQAREASVYRSTRAESNERELSSEVRSTRGRSELRSRRAQSELDYAVPITRFSASSNYASDNLLNQINSVRASSAALQEESNEIQSRIRQRRARSLEALRRADIDAYYANDDCLMRSNAIGGNFATDTARRSRREQSILSDIESRYTREGSSMTVADNYQYPQHHLVCRENCPLYTDPEHHRRFLIGSKFVDAAALGGFDVLYDPTVYSKTRKMLQRLSEERDVDTTTYESTRESSADRSRSRSRYAYNTIY
jgi:hypothetical protein